MADEAHVRSVLHLLTGAPRAASMNTRLRRTPASASTEQSPTPPDTPPLEEQAWVHGAGVSGLGVAEKEVCGRILPDIVLKVYVEKKLPTSRVAVPIPKTVQVGGLQEIETDVVEIGRIEPQSNTARIRPAIPGYSIGRAVETREAGTFGMVVRMQGQQAPWYLLSNSHAIAASGFATKGDAIIQPGGFDGGTAANDTVAALSDWVPFVFSDTGFPNLVDAAIAELTPEMASAAIAQLGIPTGVDTNLARGQYVQKMGRTTTLSVARIMDVDLRTPSTYPNGSGGAGRVGFSDQVLVTYYSSGGDSGSPVLNMKNEVVGLHVGGSTIVGVFCKIQNIINLLGIEPVTTQNVGAGPQ
jgi:hypothetical protein